jgi:hypothetical protein
VSTTLSKAAARLRAAAPRFDAEGHRAKREALGALAQVALAETDALLACHDALLFLRAHPSDAAMLETVEAQLKRLAAFLKPRRGRHAERLQEQGLPFVEMTPRFTHDCVRWLMAHPHCRVVLDSFADDAKADLNAILRLTLPSLERSETTAGLANGPLIETLRVPKSQELAFVIAELSRLDALPFVKDHLFDELDAFVRITPTDRRFSKAFSRLPMRETYFQQELVRDFDATALMNQALPAPRALDGDAQDEVVRVIKTSLVLTARETDPGTYLDPRTLRVFDLERGLTVAIYGMTAERQLPLESYVGFTLFKNGLACAYGGAWVFGPRAGFGMNIFEPYRGGESGYMMCQVLRTYRQAFGVEFFEVDAHQFGLDNPDGIATGAFWFYYRYGFRPLDGKLAQLAERERARIRATPGYRSSEKTLLRFTASNVALNFGHSRPPHVFDYTVPVTRMIGRQWRGDRVAAERACIERFLAATGAPPPSGAHAQRVLAEVALLAAANRVDDAGRLATLRRMIEVKPDDFWGYQRLCFNLVAAKRGRRAGP